jgi:hypothetical protein
MLAQVLQIFWGKEHLVKKSADLHPRQGNSLQRNYFSAVYTTSLHFSKYGGDQLKKIRPFFIHAFAIAM